MWKKDMVPTLIAADSHTAERKTKKPWMCIRVYSPWYLCHIRKAAMTLDEKEL